MYKKVFSVIIFSLFVIVGGYFFFTGQKTTSVEGIVDNGVLLATMHKSPTCGCCLGHAGYLRGENIDVDVIKESDMASIKQKYNIPYEMQSCHTTEIGDYFVEGHVPIEAINKLLAEKPDIDGISLPEMPAGSPGMPGTKSGEFVIYALKDGQATEFMRI